MTSPSRLRTVALPVLAGSGLVAAVVGFSLLPSGPSSDSPSAGTEADAAAEAHTTACRTWRSAYPAARLDEELETVRSGVATAGGLDGVEFYFDWVDVEATAATLDTAASATQQAAGTAGLDEATATAAGAHAEALTAYAAAVPEVATGEDLEALAGELATTLTRTREQLEAACADVAPSASPAAG